MRMLIAILTLSFLCSFSYAEQEQLTIATSSFDPPMEMQTTQNGVFMGFEVDLVNEICRRIKATCIYKPMTFKDIMIAVLGAKADLGIAGFFITQERLKFFLFSEPYLQTKAQLFSMADADVNLNNINTGKRIGVEEGTVFKTLLLQKYDNIKVISYQRQQDMLQDLANAKIDLIMFDFISASYWVNNSHEAFKFVGGPIPFGMGYGIISNLNNSSLMKRVNQALDAIENDGTYVSIYSRYF